MERDGDDQFGPTFPDPFEFSELISGRQLEHNLTVGDAIAALQAEPERFAPYEDIEDLAIKSVEEPGGDAEELGDQMLPIRNAIARELRASELLIAMEIIDQLLFQALKDSSGTPVVQAVLEPLRRARVGAAGFVVFGVHSLGLTADLRELIGRRGMEFIQPEWGIAVSAQTNEFERTLAFLDRVRTAFGIDEPLPQESLKHWRRSRPTRWLEVNPLLIIRVAEAAGTYYGNEALLLATLQMATSFVSMLAAAQPRTDPRERALFSTYVMNNQQTLDIHHYLVLSPGRLGGQGFDGDCVPIQRGRPDMVTMSELRIDFDRDFWTNHVEEGTRINQAARAIYRRYLAEGIDRTRTDHGARTSRRWFESMTYFQRSFSGHRWRDIITLSTAFESLLHDPSQGDTSKRIVREIKRLLGAGPEASVYAEAFRRVYRARNEILHDGLQKTDVDLVEARRAYVRAIVEHVSEMVAT
jgi:hypothetical protein